jgi:hypothetical protein
VTVIVKQQKFWSMLYWQLPTQSAAKTTPTTAL